MKLEPGKYYRTRHGRKAYVVFFTKNEFYPFCGSLDQFRITWTEDGRHNIIDEESDYDLIEEWKEPEVYEFDCGWEVADDRWITPFSVPSGVLEKLIGKRTKVRIEVK